MCVRCVPEQNGRLPEGPAEAKTRSKLGVCLPGRAKSGPGVGFALPGSPVKVRVFLEKGILPGGGP